MNREECIEALSSADITELNLGRSALRRRLANSQRVGNIVDALMMPPSEIDDILEDDRLIREFDRLRESFEGDPEAFAEKALSEKTVDVESVERRIREASSPDRSSGRASGAHRAASSRRGELVRLPDSPAVEALRRLERLASDQLDKLADHADSAVVSECFGELSFELDDAPGNFAEIFALARDRGYSPFSLIEGRLENAFLVYAADAARRLYDGRNLWDGLIAELGFPVGSQGAYNGYRSTVFRALERWGLRCYTPDDKANYYVYTLLLHSGIPDALWEDIWAVVVPLVSKAAAHGDGEDGGLPSSPSLTDEVRLSGKGKVLTEIMGNAPRELVYSIMGRAALAAAEMFRAVGEAEVVVADHGLPESAVESLLAEIEGGRGAKGRQGSGIRRKVAILPEPEMLLSPRGGVSLRWRRARLPLEYAGCIVEYSVNGMVAKVSEILNDVNRCIANEVVVDLNPAQFLEYVVESRLLRPSTDGGDVTLVEEMPKRKLFGPRRSGVLEFIADSSDSYRCRSGSGSIKRAARLAFLLDRDCTLDPGPGLVVESTSELAGDWAGYEVSYCVAEPGFCSAVVDSHGEQVSYWREGVSARIDGPSRLGVEPSGRPVFGRSPIRDGRERPIAVITCDFVGTTGAVGCSLECFGGSLREKRIATESGIRFEVYEVPYGDRGITDAKLSIDESGESGSSTCIYSCRFAFVPMTPPVVESLSVKGAYAVEAEYRSDLSCDALVALGDVRGERNAGSMLRFARDLSDERLPCAMKDSRGASVAFLLDLAGIKLKVDPGDVPRRLSFAALDGRHRSVRAEVEEAGVRTYRSAHLTLRFDDGQVRRPFGGGMRLKPLDKEHFRDFKHGASWLGRGPAMAPGTSERHLLPKKVTVDLDIRFGLQGSGTPIRRSATLMEVACDYGLGALALGLGGTAFFERGPRFRCCYRYTDRFGANLIEDGHFERLDEGCCIIDLPEPVLSRIRKRADVVLEVSSAPQLGRPRFEVAQKYWLSKEEDDG